MNTKDTIHYFIEYLINNGYPPNSLIQGYKIKNKVFDLVVIDVDSDNLVGIFEFKGDKKLQNEKADISNLRKSSENISEYPLQLHLIYKKAEAPYFEIFYLTVKNGNVDLLPIYHIPSYESLKSVTSLALKFKNRREERKTLDYFRVICWLLAVILSSLLFLDFRELIYLSPERIGILAIIIAMIIVPFAKKLNILGLEFERLITEEKRKK